jgi:carnitine O-acetyltransferase
VWNRIQFNIVSKHLGAERMSFYLNEAAGDIAEILQPGLEPPKAKL